MKSSIFFIIPSLHGGGSERVVLHLLKNLRRDSYDITLVLIQKTGIFLQDVPADVKIIDLGLSRTRYAPVKLLKLLWVHKPDLVFSTLGHLNLVMAILKNFLPKKIKFIARESSTVSIHNKNEVYPIVFDFLFKTVYKSFDKIICQSVYMQQDLVKNYNVPVSKTTIINNPVDIDTIREMGEKSENPFLHKDKINFVSVGRLSKEKGFDRLIKAAKSITNNSIHINIIGDGVDKEHLLALAKAENVLDRVSFLGFIKNPYSYMYHAKALIQTSLYEGFPNVVIEANASGIPTVAYNSPGGISEIISSNICGVLVSDGNEVQLVEAITEVANKSYNREKIIEYTKSRYALNKIVKDYESTFEEILGE